MLALLLGLASTARAEDVAGPDAAAEEHALRQILGSSVGLREKLAAADLVLARGELADPETTLQAGLALLEAAPRAGAWLILEATDAAFLPDTPLAEARGHLERIRQAGGVADDARAAWAAAALVLGDRTAETRADLLASWPPAPVVRAALDRELRLAVGARAEALGAADPQAVRDLLVSQAAVQTALDDAARDDVARMQQGLDALLALGPRAVEVLVDEVQAAARGEAPGRWPRATRAATALGLIGDRRATPALVAALEAPDGWLQVAAATALGDLGDPAAAPALAHKITYRGDVFRSRDQWDYPGVKETNVSAADWPGIDYYVVDVAAADALIRLGAVRTIPWLIRKRLDPGKANFRIRVLQDAVDSLARAVPEAPVAAYEVDAGLPQKQAAYEGLLAWWETQDAKDELLATRFDAQDAGFRREARRMVERLRGRAIFELQISQETCALLGPAVTPTLLDALGTTANPVYRTEIARALGAVDDPRAIEPLLGLMRERLAVIRATATESLASYLDGRPEVERDLIAALDDPEPSVRVAALRALVAAPLSDAVGRALDAHGLERHKATFGMEDREYARAIRSRGSSRRGPPSGRRSATVSPTSAATCARRGGTCSGAPWRCRRWCTTPSRTPCPRPRRSPDDERRCWTPWGSGGVVKAEPLHLEGLVKRHPGADRPALDDLDLDVEAAHILVLLGTSGAGKTTLLRIVAGLEDADAGRVRVGSSVLSDPRVRVPPPRRGVGLVFQHLELWPHMTVAENIAFGLPGRPRGRAAQTNATVRELAAHVGIEGLLARAPGTLSGGERQRVAIARTLAPEPAVLLYDEPLANLDPVRRVELRRLIRRLGRERKTTLVYVTHDADEAMEVGDEVAVLHRGRIVDRGAPDVLYRAPRSLAGARALGPLSALPGAIEDTRIVTALGRLSYLGTARGPKAWRSSVRSPSAPAASGPEVEVLDARPRGAEWRLLRPHRRRGRLRDQPLPARAGKPRPRRGARPGGPGDGRRNRVKRLDVASLVALLFLLLAACGDKTPPRPRRNRSKPPRRPRTAPARCRPRGYASARRRSAAPATRRSTRSGRRACTARRCPTSCSSTWRSTTTRSASAATLRCRSARWTSTCRSHGSIAGRTRCRVSPATSRATTSPDPRKAWKDRAGPSTTPTSATSSRCASAATTSTTPAPSG